MNAVSDSEVERGLIEKARRVLPGGTFGNVSSNVVIREGRGGRVWDESGREYVDFLLGSGPMLVGHAHPEVTAAAQARIAQGTTFFANNRFGIELAEAIVAAVPCAEQVRFVSTGSEADLYAMRAARAFRKRDKILKFEGGYHGMSDYSLMSLAPRRPGNFPQPIPDSAGIPRSLRDEVLVRSRAARLPAHIALVSPILSARRDETGKITDVQVEYPKDFLLRQLEIARMYDASER